MTHRNCATVCSQANASVTTLLLRILHNCGIVEPFEGVRQWVDAAQITRGKKTFVWLGACARGGSRGGGWKREGGKVRFRRVYILRYIYGRHSTPRDVTAGHRGCKVIRNGERMADIPVLRCNRDTDGVGQGFLLRLWQPRYEQKGEFAWIKRKNWSPFRGVASRIFYFPLVHGGLEIG